MEDTSIDTDTSSDTPAVSVAASVDFGSSSSYSLKGTRIRYNCKESICYLLYRIWKNLIRIAGICICLFVVLGICYVRFRIPISEELINGIIYGLLCFMFLLGCIFIWTNKKRSCLNFCNFIKKKKNKNKNKKKKKRAGQNKTDKKIEMSQMINRDTPEGVDCII